MTKKVEIPMLTVEQMTSFESSTFTTSKSNFQNSILYSFEGANVILRKRLNEN